MRLTYSQEADHSVHTVPHLAQQRSVRRATLTVLRDPGYPADIRTPDYLHCCTFSRAVFTAPLLVTVSLVDLMTHPEVMQFLQFLR